MVKIIDKLLPDNDTLKPIQLVHCLQANKGTNDKIFFETSGRYQVDKNWKSLTRLGKVRHYEATGDGHFDMILAEPMHDNKMLYLGYWNDGII